MIPCHEVLSGKVEPAIVWNVHWCVWFSCKHCHCWLSALRRNFSMMLHVEWSLTFLCLATGHAVQRFSWYFLADKQCPALFTYNVLMQRNRSPTDWQSCTREQFVESEREKMRILLYCMNSDETISSVWVLMLKSPWKTSNNNNNNPRWFWNYWLSRDVFWNWIEKKKWIGASLLIYSVGFKHLGEKNTSPLTTLSPTEPPPLWKFTMWHYQKTSLICLWIDK